VHGLIHERLAAFAGLEDHAYDVEQAYSDEELVAMVTEVAES
jgi:hypothetical protein